jgi:conjugative relaxase-like TrwC/TraI family protein
MVTISKPLSASQAQAYHRSEFASAEQSYYTQRNQVRGEWQGKLAAQWGLTGEVTEEQFARLANGRHPDTGEPLVRHRDSFEYKNEYGQTVKTMEHRAGWDATFSAPKSVSLTALVGDDERVSEAHRASVSIAVDELERYVQARIGGNHPAETTGKWAAVKFEHDSARPVDGYSAPQLHTHVVFFNVTETEDGNTRAVQPREVYKSQQYATAVYQSELASRLKALGYELDAGKNGAPEIRGYTKEYLEASSPRSLQIKAHLEEKGLEGAGPAQIATHRTRDAKVALSPDQMLVKHHQVAAEYGNQPHCVVEQARDRGVQQDRTDPTKHAQEAVTWSRDRHMEREAVVEERELLRDALKRSMGKVTLTEVKANLDSRTHSGEFQRVGPMLTTREMVDLERDNVGRMQAGRGGYAPIASESDVERMQKSLAHLSGRQRMVVEEILTSRDQVIGLQGTAGTGKTTSLAAIRAASEQQGYRVEGLAPTSRAAQQLEEAGIGARTLQHHLASGQKADDGQRRLYFVDESSLASSRQVNEFLTRLDARDRVILVGDTRQHQGVEAGKPFEQLQLAGMHTAQLDQIVRQKDPLLKAAVEQLARGEVRAAIENLAQQGRVREFTNPQERMKAIAEGYAENPENTLVVSPDNASRVEINRIVHRDLQAKGVVSREEHGQTVLTPRQDVTGADRQWAAQYAPGDVIRYTKGSRAIGIEAGEYAHVRGVDADQNILTVQRGDGKQITYDPRRLQGVNVYREVEREFAVGDRVQFTAPYKDEHIANRQIGTIEQIDADGHLQIRLDSGRQVDLKLRDHPHLDYGYAVTSHSSQGTTADRVLVHVDTENAHEQLINSRLAYVSVSRGRYDARIYTNDATKLGDELSREVSKHSALDEDHSIPKVSQVERNAAVEMSPGGEPAHAQTHAVSKSRGNGMER